MSADTLSAFLRALTPLQRRVLRDNCGFIARDREAVQLDRDAVREEIERMMASNPAGVDRLVDEVLR